MELARPSGRSNFVFPAGVVANVQVPLSADLSVRPAGVVAFREREGSMWECSTDDTTFTCPAPPLEEGTLPRYLERILGTVAKPRRIEFIGERYALPLAHGSRLLTLWRCPVIGASPVSAAVVRFGRPKRTVVLVRLDEGIAEVLEPVKNGERRIGAIRQLPRSIDASGDETPESFAQRVSASFAQLSLAFGVPSGTTILFVGGSLTSHARAARFNASFHTSPSRAEARALVIANLPIAASTHRAKLSKTSRMSVCDDGALRLTVKRETSYAVLRAQEPLFSRAAPLLADAIGDRPLFIVIDRRVDALYGTALRTYAAQNLNCLGILAISPLEESKTLAAVETICAAAIASGLPRDGVLLGVGGGVALDQAGLAASLYRRGVLFARIPTTLVGMVDVGVGIKQGVNFGCKKNFLGSFHPAFMNLIDLAFLSSLPRRDIGCGMAEIAKVATVCDARLFELLERDGVSLVRSKFSAHRAANEVIARAQLSMMAELGDNLYEDERARILDFGHTFSPVLETKTRYALSHGEAVAIDMALSTAIAVELGLCDVALLARLVTFLRSVALPVAHEALDRDVALEGLAASGAHRGRPNLVVPRAIGSMSFLQDVDVRVLDAALARTAAVR